MNHPQTSGCKKDVKEFAKQQSFGRLLCNSFKFYGRLSAICFSHNSKLSRSTKALNLATQIMLIATIVCIYHLFMEVAVSANFVGLTVFLLMRLL